VQHPYLFFTHSDLDTLRRKADGPIAGTVLRTLSRVADERLDWEVYDPELVRPWAAI